MVESDLNQAIRLYGEGRLPQAKQICQKILNGDPQHPTALSMLGVIAFKAEDAGRAVEYLSKAIQAKPDYAEAHNNLGNILRELDRLGEAEESYRRALDLKPDFADFHNNLGITLTALGRLDDAVASCRRAISLNPGLAQAHNSLGGALQALGRLDEAAASYRQAITLNPEFADAHSNLGGTLRGLGLLDDAVAGFQKALTITPEFAEAHIGFGNTLNRLGRLDDAVEHFRKAITIKPDFAAAHYGLGNTSYKLGRLKDAVASTKKALVLKPDFAEAARNLIYLLLYVPDLNPQERFAEHVRFSETQTEGIDRAVEKLTNDAAPDRRLRIGYLSSDFFNHPVGSNMLPLLSCHDREKFEVFCYGDVRRPDTVTERFRRAADHWRPITAKPDAEVAAMIRADAIDVLVCLAGHFGNNRPLVSAHRAAPVQVSFHDGATSGLKEMDYWLTDDYLHPQDTPEIFTEELYRLDVFYNHPRIEDAPAVGALAADQAGFITFGSFNNPAKLNEHVIDLWARVLNAVAGSRLVLKYKNLYAEASLQGLLLERFGASGIDHDRVIFEASSDTMSEHLGRYGSIDIALDPFPFNGATTTFQALWMGVPVVSLAGETFISRAAASMLGHVGLGDLGVDTPDAYVAGATGLATDLPRLKSLRESLRDRVTSSPLCDAPAYARGIEAAYRDMWRRWCAAVVVVVACTIFAIKPAAAGPAVAGPAVAEIAGEPREPRLRLAQGRKRRDRGERRKRRSRDGKSKESGGGGGTIAPCTACEDLDGFVPPDEIADEIRHMVGKTKGDKNKAVAIQKARGGIETGLQPAFIGGAGCPEIDSEQWAIDYSYKRPWAAIHKGIDIPQPNGTPIRAMAAGTVVGKFLNDGNRKGIEVMLRHTPQQTGLKFWTYSQYTHLRQMSPLAIGDSVEMGQEIGKTSNTGKMGRRIRRDALHLAVLYSENPAWSNDGRFVIPKQSYWMDPNAFFRLQGPYDSPSMKALPDNQKAVPVPFMKADGSFVPAQTRRIWPYVCE